MKANFTAWDQVKTIAQIADIKEANYRNTLALSALIEILVEKGIITPEDFHQKASGMEREDTLAAEYLMSTSPESNPMPSDDQNKYPSNEPGVLP